MGVYEEKPDKEKYNIRNKKQHTVLANSRATGYKINYKKQHPANCKYSRKVYHNFIVKYNFFCQMPHKSISNLKPNVTVNSLFLFGSVIISVSGLSFIIIAALSCHYLRAVLPVRIYSSSTLLALL